MAAAIGAPGRERRPSRVTIRCACAVLLLATGTATFATPAREVPPPAYRLAAHRADVPAAVLYAVALQESGAMLRGRLRPWPWTRNVARAPQRHMAGSSMGQITSGLCCMSIHLTALMGTPGPAQGAE